MSTKHTGLKTPQAGEFVSPADICQFSIDFGPNMPGATALSGVTWAIPTQCTQVAAFEVGTIAYVVVSGFTAYDSHELRCTATGDTTPQPTTLKRGLVVGCTPDL